MTTLIIHGTNRIDGPSRYRWWREGPFVDSLRRALAESGGMDDVWSVDGSHVSTVQAPSASRMVALRGRAQAPLGFFEWSGTHMSLDRHAGARELASYLTALARLSSEPIRIVAYSHGCNVVKGASVHSCLDPAVRISRAVFLGCPHIYADTASGRLHAYRLDPERFGGILNLRLPDDVTQTSLPNTVIGPPTARWMAWAPPRAAGEDPEAAAVYENALLAVSEDVAPEDRHAHLHGTFVAALVGRWLAGTDGLADILRQMSGSSPAIPAGDTGDPDRDADYRIIAP